MITKIVKISVMVFTLVTIGYMSVSMSAEADKTQSIGGKGLSVGAKDSVPPENSTQDQSSGGGAPVAPPAAEGEGVGCCG